MLECVGCAERSEAHQYQDFTRTMRFASYLSASYSPSFSFIAYVFLSYVGKPPNAIVRTC